MRKIHTNYFLLIKKVVTKEIFVHFVIQKSKGVTRQNRDFGEIDFVESPQHSLLDI